MILSEYSPGQQKRHLLLLTCLFLLGLAVRMFFLAEIQDHLDFQIPLLYQVDMGFIDNSALDRAQSLRSLCHLSPIEENFERPSVWRHQAGNPQLRPPGYTFFLSLIYFIFGDNQLLVRIPQMMLGLISGWLGYRLGRKAISPAGGLITAGALWLYWPLILYESVLHEPVLMVFASLLFLNSAFSWLKEERTRQAVLVGVSCGFFTMVSSQVILFLPVLLVWMVWRCLSRERSIRRVLTQTALAGLFFFLPLLPVTALNYHESGRWVLNCHGHGVTLYIANQPEATGLLMPADALLEEYLGQDVASLRVDEKTALIEDWIDWSHFAQKAALREILHAPGAFVKRSLKRAVLFWAPFEISQNVLEYCDRGFSPTLSHMPGSFGMLLPFVVLGLFYGAVRIRQRLSGLATLRLIGADTHLMGLIFLILFILIWYLPYLVLWVSAHFRIPLLPALFLLAAEGIFSFISDIKNKKEHWRRALSGGLCALLFLLPALLASWDYSADIQTWLYYRVKLYTDRGRNDEALALSLQGAQHWPAHAFVQKSCADLLFEAGRDEEALGYYEKALSCEAGEIDRAAVLENLGVIHRHLQENEEAKEVFLMLLESNPHHPGALHYLGNIAYEEGQYEEARAYLEKATADACTKGNTFFLLGLTLRSLGHNDEALQAFRRGHALDPEDEWILLELADVLILTQEKEEACQLYRQLKEGHARAEEAWQLHCLEE
jgi:tetratricopeptide (TPR) repeat protein